MKKSLLLVGLMFLLAQPAFSQGKYTSGTCPIPKQPVYQQPIYQRPVYQQTYRQPVYQQPGQKYSQQIFYTYPNSQYMTGAAAPINYYKKPKSAWRTFVEDYLGFD